MEKRLKLYEEVLFRKAEGLVSNPLVPKHPKLRQKVFALISSLAEKNSFDEMELYSEAATIAWDVLSGFNLAEGADWDAIISGEDKHNLNRIVLAIIRKLEHELPAAANPNTKRMYDPETGGKMFVTVNFETLDRPFYDSNGEIDRTLVDDMEESYFSDRGPTLENSFLAWFRANRADFLTARQNAFIDAMSSATLQKDTDYVDENDFEERIGMKPGDMDRIKKRIKARTLAAWDAHTNGKPEYTRRGRSLQRQIDELSEFLRKSEDDGELESQNIRLSQWIKGQETLFQEDVVDFLYDKLTADIPATKDLAEFLKGDSEQIRPQTLYKIRDIISEEARRLSDEIATLPPSSGKWEPNTDSRRQNCDRKARYKEFAGQQPCYVYDSEGAHVGTLTPELREYKIVELNALGTTHNIHETP